MWCVLVALEEAGESLAGVAHFHMLYETYLAVRGGVSYLNGERRQSGNTKSLIFPVEDLIARISAVMTLLPGDLIATGTPAGVGSLQPGDKIEVRIEGIGSLANPVIRLSPRSGPERPPAGL